MAKKIDVAVVGANGLVGEAVIELLASRKFPVGILHPLVTKDEAGGKLEFKGQYVTQADVAKFDFGQAQIALFCGDAALAAKFAPKATKAGAWVIDCSEQFRLEADVPLVVADVNLAAAASAAKRIVAMPDSTTTIMLTALAGLHERIGVERVNVAGYLPVSLAGKEGVETLAGETVALLNMKPVKPKCFEKQIAFNVLPRVGKTVAAGYTNTELGLVAEARKVLGLPELKCSATLVQVPVFFGLGLALNVETREKIAVEEVVDLLSNAPGTSVLDDVKLGGFPTPVTEAAGKETVYVGRIRADISHSRGLDLWVVADAVRVGSALNAVRIAEFLTKNCVAL